MPKFTSQEDVAMWLNTASPAVAQVFAARAALRALPSLASEFGLHGNQLRGSEYARVALRTFRCVQVAWAFTAYPSHDAVLKVAVRLALKVQPVSTSHLERSAAYAVAAANDNSPEFARAAANYAIEAVTGPQEHFEAMLNAYSADADLLDQRTSPVTLANSQLWPGRLPAWVLEAWDELKRALLASGDDWIVWTDWYEERLKGRPGLQSQSGGELLNLEVARAAVPQEMWGGDPATLNAHIRELFRSHGISRYEIRNERNVAQELKGLTQQELAIIG